jgi:uncharacterized protein GlcG (DUF336 family)
MRFTDTCLAARPPRARAFAVLAALVGIVGALDVGSLRVSTQAGRGGAVQALTADDVGAVIMAAAQAISDTGMAIAVVDRAGRILGVWARNGAAPSTPDVAVSLARTTAFFSNDQAPLSSRTVRFISGIHFPPGIKNAANAALYGVENINRGCALDAADALYPDVPRPRSLRGTPGGSASPTPSPCRPSDTSGCAQGGPIIGETGQPIPTGITTGKRDLRDSNNGSEDAINPGGISIYRGGHLVGGIGVAGVPADRAEYAALVGAAGTRSQTGLTAAIAFPNLLPAPGAIYIDGIRLPFYSTCGTDIACIDAASRGRPPGSSPGSFLAGGYVFPPRNGGQAPEGYLSPLFPRGGLASSSGLTASDVAQIVNQSVAEANTLRGQVRLPFGQTPTFIIAVTDEGGNILAEYRMQDALFDAVDVVPSKARNAYYFSTPEGYQALKRYVTSNPYDHYAWTPDPPGGAWAITSRTISFGGQPLFPPGIDLEKASTPGPWFDLFVYDTLNACTEGDGPSRGGNRTFPNQNGITWFPGSVPLYKNGRLVGGLGVSGDGVEQNDLVSAAGSAGFEPPPELRVDNSVIHTGAGDDVRLPYLKFPRNPTQP